MAISGWGLSRGWGLSCGSGHVARFGFAGRHEVEAPALRCLHRVDRRTGEFEAKGGVECEQHDVVVRCRLVALAHLVDRKDEARRLAGDAEDVSVALRVLLEHVAQQGASVVMVIMPSSFRRGSGEAAADWKGRPL